MKTQPTESSIWRFTVERQKVNETCLNRQAERSTVQKIVENTLEENDDDCRLGDTLWREFTVKDVIDKLELIKEMRDHAAADQERFVMGDFLESILTGVQVKAIRHGSSQAILDDWLTTLAILAEITWSARPCPAMDSDQNDLTERFVRRPALSEWHDHLVMDDCKRR